ncbi:hypothetical protein ACRRTK_022018 [Alexandromys fortis]
MSWTLLLRIFLAGLVLQGPAGYMCVCKHMCACVHVCVCVVCVHACAFQLGHIRAPLPEYTPLFLFVDMASVPRLVPLEVGMPVRCFRVTGSVSVSPMCLSCPLLGPVILSPGQTPPEGWGPSSSLDFQGTLVPILKLPGI